MSSNRARMTAAVVAVALLLGGGAVALGLAGRGGNNPPGSSASPSLSTSSPATTSAPTGTSTQGPRPPAQGAWVGAWVKPGVPTQAGRVQAVADFERDIGRTLAVVHTFHKWADEFPSQADIDLAGQSKVLMISWAGADTRLIQSGRYDELIRARAQEIKAWGVPFLLRFRWEMNRPNLGALVWTPADYIAAWKHVRAIFSEVGATNAAWVWCPIATNFNATNGPAFYPGDDQVDWLCTDVYPGQTHDSFSNVSREFLTYAAQQHPTMPVIIGEFGTENPEAAKRTQWIVEASAFVRSRPQIKAWVYFDAQREENGVQRDFTLQGTGGPLAAFRTMASLPYFNPPVP